MVSVESANTGTYAVKRNVWKIGGVKLYCDTFIPNDKKQVPDPSKGVYSFRKRSKRVLSGDEIQCLLRLILEGIPERISRSWHLVRRSVALVCGKNIHPWMGQAPSVRSETVRQSKSRIYLEASSTIIFFSTKRLTSFTNSFGSNP